MAKCFSFETQHFYPNFERQLFWDLFNDFKWQSKSEIFDAVTVLNKPGKDYPLGVGAIRTITMQEKMEFVEEILEFEPPQLFHYRLIKTSLPLINYHGKIRLEEGENGVLFRYNGRYETKYQIVGWAFKFFLRKNIQKMFPLWKKAYLAYYPKLA